MKKTVLVFLLFSILTINAQEIKNDLTGVLAFDTQLALEQIRLDQNLDSLKIMEQMKSPFLAGAMSVAIPGAGQFYNGDYWKTAIFVAVEAVAIYAAITYNQEGDDQTTLFENYAHQNWSVNRYAEWSRESAEYISGKTFTEEQKQYYNTALINKEGVVNWDVLNDLELDIGAWYSHRLAPFADQQYYEMIGKYPQFVSGWDDFKETYPDGVFLYPEDGKKVTPYFHHYKSERGKANDYYAKAKTAVAIIIANHVISAAEAAWTTSRNNKKLNVSVSMAQHNLGFVAEYYPQMNLQYTF